MSLPVYFFEYSNFTFDIRTFIKYWTRIEEMLYNSYTCDEIYEYKLIFEQIKQKKFYEFTTPEEESIPLRRIIHHILFEEYDQNPLEIFKEFYYTIKNDMGQGMYGHRINIYKSQNNIDSENDIYNYSTFYQTACGFQDNSWPHHYVLKKEAFYKVKNIPIKVYFALIAMNYYMIINEECEAVYWGN